MASLPQTFVTLEQYLELESKSEVPHEYLDGEVFEMEATTLRHQRIASKLHTTISAFLKGGLCEVFSQRSRIATSPAGLYTYPDIVIVGDKVQVSEKDPDAITNPKVLIEILSPQHGGL